MKLINSLFGSGDKGINMNELKKLTEEELTQMIETKRDALIKEFRLSTQEKAIEVKDGVTGLRNMGNTCFMSAVLQCLSNTEILTRLILSKNWVNHINSVSTAAEGRMVCVYFQFLTRIWAESHYSITPKAIKNTIVGVSRTFAGYSQQDSQEFLSYFLDALHEDLNKVAIKPYIEREDYKGQELNGFGASFWKGHIKRNDSPIVDLFHGQVYSKLKCPDCGFTSITFDPFDMINLEIPKKAVRKFEGYVVSYTHGTDTMAFNTKLSSSMSLKEAVGIVISNVDNKLDPDNFTVVFMHRSKIKEIVTDPSVMTVAQAMDNENLMFIFETYSETVKSVFEELDSNESTKNRCVVRMDVFQDGVCKGLERQYTLPESASVKEIYRFALFVYRRKLYLAKLKGSEQLNKEGPAENIKGEFSLFFPDSTVDKKKSPFYITINDEEIVDLKDSKKKLLKEKHNSIKVIVNSDVMETAPRFKSASRLSILPQKSAPQDLYSCLDHFVTEEKLDAQNTWYCSRCKDHKEAFKQMRLMKLPEILIIHLKRFKKSHHRYGISLSKITDYIDPPFELDMKRYLINQDSKNTKYELYGVVNHFGNCGGGHYTAFCRNFLDGQWYDFDDSDVKKINVDDVPTRYAYVLFYKRMGSK